MDDVNDTNVDDTNDMSGVDNLHSIYIQSTFNLLPRTDMNDMNGMNDMNSMNDMNDVEYYVIALKKINLC